MAENIIFGWPQALASATVIESSTAVAGMPGDNVLEVQPTDRFRSTDIAQSYVEIDLGSAQAMDFVALIAVNATGSAQWRVRMATSKANLTSSPGYDSTATTFWMNGEDYSDWARMHSFIDIGSTKTYRYIRYDVADSTNPDGYIDMGCVIAMLKSQPNVNIAYGSSYPMPVEEPDRLESEGGLIHPIPHAARKQATFDIETVTEATHNQHLFDLARLRGTHSPVIVVPFPDSTYAMDTLVYGLLSQPMTTSIPSYNVWRTTFSVEELV